MRLINGIMLVMVAVLIQGCVTNKNTSQGGAAVARDVNMSSTDYTTPSIQNNSYMYRSPPAAAVQAHGLAR